MRIVLYYNKTLTENADIYYKKAKEYGEKAKNAEKALKELEERIKKVEKEEARKEKERERLTKRIDKKKWYEKFFYFFTSNGLLCIGGKNAEQNEMLVKKYMESKDLFFHAEVQGSVVILKNGLNADIRDKIEAAQFAACFSRAWKENLNSIDVFAAKKEQLTKEDERGKLKKGGFNIIGQREWFKNMQLRLKLRKNKNLEVLPAMHKEKASIFLSPGGKFKKGEIANRISKMLGIHPDEVMERLPSGSFYISVLS